MPKPTIFWGGCPELMGYLDTRLPEFLETLRSLESTNWKVIQVKGVSCYPTQRPRKRRKRRSPKDWRPRTRRPQIEPPDLYFKVDLILEINEDVLTLVHGPRIIAQEIQPLVAEIFASFYSAIPEGMHALSNVHPVPGEARVDLLFMFGPFKED